MNGNVKPKLLRVAIAAAIMAVVAMALIMPAAHAADYSCYGNDQSICLKALNTDCFYYPCINNCKDLQGYWCTVSGKVTESTRSICTMVGTGWSDCYEMGTCSYKCGQATCQCCGVRNQSKWIATSTPHKYASNQECSTP